MKRTFVKHQSSIMRRAIAGGVILATAVGMNLGAAGEEESPRRTATVKLIERCLPSVVVLRTIGETDKAGVVYFGVGSGVIVHPAGYILTNQHVVNRLARGEAQLADNRLFPIRVVASWAFEDLAVLKIDAPGPLPTLPLGRSNDLMLGEPALTIGNPGGLSHSVSTGIISGLSRTINSDHGASLPWVIQTSAAVNGGNSGGPFINALGDLIGIVTANKGDAQNIGFAIAIDRVREVFPRIIAAEQRYGFRLGIEVDMLGSSAKVTAVGADSPAAKAGLQQGDVIRRVDAMEIRHGVDFHLALINRQPDQKLEIEFLRDKEVRKVACELTRFQFTKPATPDHLVPGLDYATYLGRWEKLPDFAALKPAAAGTTATPSLGVHPAGGDNFGVRFTGFIKIPADGLYTFSTKSDDGSRLYLDDQLVVDNDGLHATSEAGGLARLAAGLHPITITYFQGPGGAVLETYMEGPGVKKQPLAAAQLFHRKPPPEKAAAK